MKTKILTSQTNPKPRWCQDNELTKDFQAFVRSLFGPNRRCDRCHRVRDQNVRRPGAILHVIERLIVVGVTSCPELSRVTIAKTC